MSYSFLAFFGTLLAALIGAMLAPYFSDFLNRKKIRREEQLRRLEEAYLLSLNITSYVNQAKNEVLLSIAALKGQIKIEDIAKGRQINENPLPKLFTLLDFHLTAAETLKTKVNKINDQLMLINKPISQAINSHEITEKDKYFEVAVGLCNSELQEAPLIQEEVVRWLKTEKKRLLSKKPDWKNFWHKIQIEFDKGDFEK